MPMTKNRIAELRKGINLTQKELGKLLDVDETTVSRWENGSRQPDADALKALAQIFKIETHELFLDPRDLNTPTGPELVLD